MSTVLEHSGSLRVIVLLPFENYFMYKVVLASGETFCVTWSWRHA